LENTEAISLFRLLWVAEQPIATEVTQKPNYRKEKTMKLRILVFGLGIILMLSIAAGCAGDPPTPTPTPTVDPAPTLVAAKCGTCHPLANLQAAKYDEAGWATTVDRMIGKGAQLNADQKQLVVSYLAKTYSK
jgi:hypothetical protein